MGLRPADAGHGGGPPPNADTILHNLVVYRVRDFVTANRQDCQVVTRGWLDAAANRLLAGCGRWPFGVASECTSSTSEDLVFLLVSAGDARSGGESGATTASATIDRRSETCSRDDPAGRKGGEQLMRSATPLRLLLLLLVVAGVAGMHTIGHPVGSGHGAIGDEPQVAQMNLGASDAMPSLPPDRRVGAPATGMVMNPLDVCLAVLVGTVVLFHAAPAARLGRGATLAQLLVAAAVRTGRGPPGRVLFGLTLAELSVQRT